MCYHILIATGKVMTIGSVQRVTNLEMQIYDIKYEFANLDVHMFKMLQSPHCGYDGAKPKP